MSSAASIQSVAICDTMGPDYRDEAAFVDAVLGAVAIEWRRAGVTGIRILAAELANAGPPPSGETPAPDTLPLRPRLFLRTGPGQAPLDRAALDAFLATTKGQP